MILIGICFIDTITQETKCVCLWLFCLFDPIHFQNSIPSDVFGFPTATNQQSTSFPVSASVKGICWFLLQDNLNHSFPSSFLLTRSPKNEAACLPLRGTFLLLGASVSLSSKMDIILADFHKFMWDWIRMQVCFSHFTLNKRLYLR